MGLFSRTSIGIDIGHASVKVAGITLGKKPKLIGCKEVTVDPAFLKKEGFENHVAIGAAIKQAMKDSAPNRIAPAPVHVVISEAVLFRKVLELPNVPGSDMDGAVRIAVMEYLPEGLDAVELDYQILPGFGEIRDAKEGVLPTVSVMVVATSKTVVQDFQQIFKIAGLQLKSIEPKPCALSRSVIKAGAKEAIVLIDVGSELSTISLCSHGVINVASTVNFGGNLLRDPETGGLDEAKMPAGSKRLAEAIADEVEHVVKFYTNRSGSGDPMGGIILSGGGSMVTDVKDALSSATALEVTLAKPSITVPAFCDRRFYGALGAAMYPLYETA